MREEKGESVRVGASTQLTPSICCALFSFLAFYFVAC